MEDTIKPVHLLIDELNYELRIRGIVTTRDIAQKRKILARALEKDRSRNLELSDPEFDYNTERDAINSTLDSIGTLIGDFEGPPTDSSFKRIKSRLTHITERVKRMPIPLDMKEEAATFKNESYASCLELEAKLYERITSDNASVNLETSMVQPQVQLVPTPSTSSPKSVPVYKWNVKFDGELRSGGVNAFLERVDELAYARGVSKADLFLSSVDLFSGKALIWYRSVKNSVRDWDSLVALLKQQFLPSDYDDQLWDEIKARTQGRNESVTIFIAVMEALFGRLARPPCEFTRVKFIKQNLLPQYISHLALSDIDTVAELSKFCRKLEEAASMKNRQRLPQTRLLTNTLEPELAYLDSESLPSTSSGNFNKKYPRRSYFHNSRKERYTSGHQISEVSSNNSKSVVCWNCRQPNHTYTNCRQKRSVFCYKCGKPNVTAATCSHSGNE